MSRLVERVACIALGAAAVLVTQWSFAPRAAEQAGRTGEKSGRASSRAVDQPSLPTVRASVSAGSDAHAPLETSPPSAILMRRALLKAGMTEDRADALLKHAERAQREIEQTLQTADGSGSLAEVEAQRAAIRDLGIELRKQLGDEDYDWFLYASGIANRMVVQEAPGAEILGDIDIKPGDVLLSYDGTRVLRPSELQRLWSEGQRGARVKVELLRHGELIATSLPRGPLGVTFTTARLTP